MTISFFVPGHPKTAGSKRAFIPKGWTRAIITDAAGKAGKDWRGDVKKFAQATYTSSPLPGPLRLLLTFVMPRPRSHYRTGKLSHELRADAPVLHTGKPDAIKMARAVEDALTGILWNDDAQICAETIEKIYGSKPGCKLTLVELE